MSTQEEEIQLRCFLLGKLEEEKREGFGECILKDRALLDHLSVVEEELIDEYLFEA